ncbi:MAG: hypothetical protein AAFV45_11975 [Pseudomonadota bacterium]
MSMRSRQLNELGDENTEIAKSTVDGGRVGGWAGVLTGVASTVALIFSAISLYHSVLKQPELQFHVPPVVHYTRDASGNYEVFAIPMTVSNHGARDGTVLDVELIATSAGGAETKTFYSAYQVDGTFFVKPGAFDREKRRFERVARPKQPFAPISVAGRSSYSGTLLFYTKDKPFPKIVSGSGVFDLTLRLNTRLDDSLGAVDALLANPPVPVNKRVKLGFFSEQNAKQGTTYRMIDVDWQKQRANMSADEVTAEASDDAAEPSDEPK